MYRTLHIGPAALQTAFVLYLLGFYLATEFATRNAKRHHTNGNTIQNAMLVGLVGGLVGARLVFAVLHWAAYQDDLSAWFSIRPQGLNVVGGVIVGSAVMLAFGRWRRVALRDFLEIITPGVGILMVVLPLAFLAEGSVFGKASELPWAIELWGLKRHPTQVYAAIGSAVTFGIWWRYRDRLDNHEFLVIVTGNALTWMLVGFLLAEPALALESYRLVQVMAWAVLVVVAFAWNLSQQTMQS